MNPPSDASKKSGKMLEIQRRLLLYNIETLTPFYNILQYLSTKEFPPSETRRSCFFQYFY